MITSLDNEKIKKYSKLSKRKYRDSMGLFLVEGEHLVQEAIKAQNVVEIFMLEGTNYNYDGTTVNEAVMKKLSSLDTICDICCVCRKNTNNEIKGSRLLLLDEIQDPGNLGTIIRSSVAFNIDTIILSENSVDLYNPKVLRATQGMYNYINIITMNSVDCVNKVKKLGITVYGTSVTDGVDVRSLMDIEKNNFLLILGNEGNGISKDVLDLVDKNLYISMNDKVESLNVGVAGSILLYELRR